MAQGTFQRSFVDSLVQAMLEHVVGLNIDLRELASDPAGTIESVDDIELSWVDPAALTGSCSVAALYFGQEHPPRILAAWDTSPGRRAFSLLHEFGHHLRNRVDAVADAFWNLPDGGASIEEDLVDSFAAAVLLPADVVTETFANGVDAAAVLGLWRATPASREACCVAAARELPAPGYVMLLDSDGRCQFAARHGDVYAIRRGTDQTAVRIRPALRGGTARGVDRPTLHGGVASSEMHVDALADDGYVFSVWVSDSPAWTALPITLDSGPIGLEGYCETCGKEFISWKAKCQTCADPFCPECGACSCAPSDHRLRSSRRCDRCFMELPLPSFVGDSTTCIDH